MFIVNACMSSDSRSNFNNIGVSPSPDAAAFAAGIVLLGVFAFRYAGGIFAVESIAGKGTGSRA